MKVIYKIESPANKVYIGQTKHKSNRFSKYKRLDCASQVYLYRSLKKYGFSNHNISIVHELPDDCSQNIVDQYERTYIDVYRLVGYTMLNIKDGGLGGSHSKESIKKMSFSHSAMKPETIEKMRLAKSNISDETRLKMSMAKKGKGLGNKRALGYKHSPDALQKIKEAGKNKSEHTRSLVSENMKRIWAERRALKYA
ncbi:MAG: GIY-YIG nuclease family protein [Chitinophagaceae bacterium]|nr:GIY-YIG nuclease family protein [Chitinophagaceae bacterium]